jgi:hypothetical protein
VACLRIEFGGFSFPGGLPDPEDPVLGPEWEMQEFNPRNVVIRCWMSRVMNAFGGHWAFQPA